MNKRQAKKNFKKKYGFNPNEFEGKRVYTLDELQKYVESIDWYSMGRVIRENIIYSCKIFRKEEKEEYWREKKDE